MKWVENKWKFVKSEAITPEPITPKETSESLTKSAKKRKLVDDLKKKSSKERIKEKKNKMISQCASKNFNSVRNLYNSNLKSNQKKDANKSISPRLPLSTMLKNSLNTSISPRLPPSTNKKKGTNRVAFDLPKAKVSARNKKKSTSRSQKINIKVVTPGTKKEEL